MPATRKRFVRPDTHAVFLEDEGGIAYLYDITNRAAILERGGADLARTALRDIAEGAAPDSAVSAIGKEGLFLVYDLGGDGGLAAEIAVGPALDRKELKANPGLIWKKPQVAKLALPSGRLCVETANSCHIELDPEEAGPEESALVEVPPGNYLVRVYRVDQEQMDAGDVEVYAGALNETWESLGELITLTPVAEEAKVPSKLVPFLPYPVAPPPKANDLT